MGEYIINIIKIISIKSLGHIIQNGKTLECICKSCQRLILALLLLFNIFFFWMIHWIEIVREINDIYLLTYYCMSFHVSSSIRIWTVAAIFFLLGCWKSDLCWSWVNPYSWDDIPSYVIQPIKIVILEKSKGKGNAHGIMLH